VALSTLRTGTDCRGSPAGRVRVGLLGTTTVTLDGNPVHLTPGTVRLLLRLVAAEGEAVTASQLFLDLWPPPLLGRVGQRERNEVQKRVLELRRKMEPGQPTSEALLVHTESVPTARYTQSAYRLVLGREQLDYLEFTELVNRAAHAPPATAVALLTRALELWRGAPLADVAGQDFAARLVTRLKSLRKVAREELARNLTELGRPEAALPVAEDLVADFPDDAELAKSLRSLRERLRARHASDVLRREFSGLRVELLVRRGDLFDQDDANLVIGFGDTFDTATDSYAAISRDSVQGQLAERVYGGDRKRLDADLAKGLQGIQPVAVESAQAKPRGKRRRYPVGTVVRLPLDGRRVFAVVHCRQDLDLVTHSSAAELRLALEQVWRAARQHGLLKPVAIPVVGADLARVNELSREQLMIMIIDTFLKSCRDSRCAPELRIVLRPSDMERVRIPDIARFVEALDQDGR
jgi:O-acetyl-ADP-ribose deacetylase (regulator of RNase III)